MQPKDEKWAIFWCSLLHPVIFNEVEPDERARFIQELSEKECLFPNGVCKKPSLSTLKRKLEKVHRGRF